MLKRKDGILSGHICLSSESQALYQLLVVDIQIWLQDYNCHYLAADNHTNETLFFLLHTQSRQLHKKVLNYQVNLLFSPCTLLVQALYCVVAL